MARSVSTRTRSGDGNRRFRFLAWWQRWRDPIFAAVLLPTAVAVLWLGLDKRAADRANAKVTRDGCVRAKALGPSFILDYEKRNVLSAKNLELYRSLIPKTCPK